MLDQTDSCNDSSKLFILLSQTQHILATLQDEEINKYGISNAEIGVLFVIQAIRLTCGRQTTPTEISKHLVRKAHSISELLSRMEKKSLIIRTKDNNNKKRVNIEITEKGRRIYESAMQGQIIISQIINILSNEEKANLDSSLKKITTYALNNYKSSLGSLPFSFFNLFDKYVYMLSKLTKDK
ncbi:MAG: winged helix DNA-binding protein [Dehalococcoidales bacterium]|nr:winged helix DNA-binding protein [Dehalococcoidales bacterium]